MRRIIKETSPGDFEQWKTDNPGKTFRDLLPGKIKTNLKKSLMKEQYGLCGYCCSTLTKDKSHIEHIIPHSSGKQQLDYTNLICSCNGYNINRETCGHKKDNDFIPISPTDVDCESHFKYSTSGKILPSNSSDTDAKQTIDTLNLNSYELVTARKTKIKLLLLDTDDIRNDKTSYISKYSTPVNGKLEAFTPMILYVINNYI